MDSSGETAGLEREIFHWLKRGVVMTVDGGGGESWPSTLTHVPFLGRSSAGKIPLDKLAVHTAGQD